MGFGDVEGVKASRTTTSATARTTLFAALNVLNGAVLACCKPRHRLQEFLLFLRRFDTAVPADLDIHRIVDNDATQSPARQGMAGEPAPLAPALDPDLQLLGQSGRTLLRADHRPSHSSRLVHERQAARATH